MPTGTLIVKEVIPSLVSLSGGPPDYSHNLEPAPHTLTNPRPYQAGVFRFRARVSPGALPKYLPRRCFPSQ
jgi:hypothetical protein